MILAFILWVIFFQVGHWWIVKKRMKFVVLAYTIILLGAYTYYLYSQNVFKKPFIDQIALSAPLIILVWTIWEVIERILKNKAEGKINKDAPNS